MNRDEGRKRRDGDEEGEEYAETSISSDVIHPTTLGSLYGWLIILTTLVSISELKSSISRFTLFSSELLEIPNSRRNIGVGVHDQPCRPSVQDLTTSLHTIYGFFMGLLLALMAIKYQGSSTNPFIEHSILMMLFMITISMYGVALTITLRRSNHEHSANKLMASVSHICGVLACELLLLVLVSPIQSLFINLSMPTLIAMLALYKKYNLLHAQGTEEQGSQMPDLEASAISAA
ncbi:hypothetical protein K1719_019870 [Acacia pycnantha]|nr:hypothetical protein K1719_019870 [Acacia pycnantha]